MVTTLRRSLFFGKRELSGDYPFFWVRTFENVTSTSSSISEEEGTSSVRASYEPESIAIVPLRVRVSRRFMRHFTDPSGTKSMKVPRDVTIEEKDCT